MYDGRDWRTLGPGEHAHAPRGAVHALRKTGDQPASVLMLLSPGVPREDYFRELSERGDRLTDAERAELHRRHDNHFVASTGESPNPTQRRDIVSTPFIFVTTHRVDQATRPQLRAAVDEYATFGRDNEEGLLAQYSFLSGDGSELSMLHVLTDADAADRHMQLAHELIGQGVQLTAGNTRIDVYGAPEPLLTEACNHNAGNGVEVNIVDETLAGFSRA